MLTIDGSYGEGGGQIVRTALALSCVTGRTVEIINIRANRRNPGLQPQHLTGVLACAQIGGANVEGAELGSRRLVFSPGRITGGDYTFDVEQTAGKGSAGSIALILQAVLLPLSRAAEPSRIILRGGTHVSRSPSIHYLIEVFLPTIRRMGVQADVELVRWGFYPIGKGEAIARISPSPTLNGFAWDKPDHPVTRVAGISAVANLPMHIAERQKDAASRVLSAAGIACDIHVTVAPAVGRGTACFLSTHLEAGAGGFGALGEIGKRAEVVGREAAEECVAFAKSGAAVDRHLADQILPYLAMARGPSAVITEAVSTHLLTNLWVIRQFVDREVRVEGELGGKGRVVVE